MYVEMNYSTLKEVYNVDSFEKERKRPKRVKEVEKFEDAPPGASGMQQAPKDTHCFAGDRPVNEENILPYYDEDLEQYLNVQDFQNAIPYIKSKMLNDTQGYQLQHAPQAPQASQAQQAQQAHDKQYRSTVDPKFAYQQHVPYVSNVVLPQENRQMQRPQQTQQTQQALYPAHIREMQEEPPAAPVVEPVKTKEMQISDVKQDAMVKSNLFYKNLINIGLFIFVGVLIIFLCDQITEIAINIGMKRTMAILEPYLIDISERKSNYLAKE